MGLFGKKKDQMPSLSELEEVHGNKRGEVKGVRKLTDAEMKEAARKARGQVSRKGDLKAGMQDLRNGRTGSSGAPLPKRPVDGKGNPRSSWW